MLNENRIRIAVQKSGRLSEKSFDLFKNCGLEFDWTKDKLISLCNNFPIDLMLVRDDDIPEYVLKGICELGIVGENVLIEKLSKKNNETSPDKRVKILKKLGFGKCRLSLAINNKHNYQDTSFFQNKKIATSYPNALESFLMQNKINAEIIELNGSVEIAPTLKIADAICDIVSTGSTLRSHGLMEVECILNSQSVLIKTKQPLNEEKENITNKLLQRIEGVMRANNTKYILMNAPQESIEEIKNILPGMENLSVITVDGNNSKVAIHAVCSENIFWETMDKLKKVGASSILVMPIEKIIL